MNIFQKIFIVFVIFQLQYTSKKVSSAALTCDIAEPFSDPCGDAGLCVPSVTGSGYSCDCKKFKSTLYEPSVVETSCTGEVKSFCPPGDRTQCNYKGDCRSGYGTLSCLCDSNYHNQYCSSESDPNMTYYQSPMILFKNKAALGSIRTMYLLASSIGTQPSFKIFDMMEERLKRKKIVRLGRAGGDATRDYENVPQMWKRKFPKSIYGRENVLKMKRHTLRLRKSRAELDQNGLLGNLQDRIRSFDDVKLSGRDLCVQQFHDEPFCSIIPEDVKPAAKIQYPATKKDTIDYIFDDRGNFRGQMGEFNIMIYNKRQLQFRENLFVFGAAQGNRSSCITHLKLQDCSLDIPFLQRDDIVLRSYISPSIFCDQPVSMYNVDFQWNVFAGFGKLFNSNFPFKDPKPTSSSSEQNIFIAPFSLYQDKTLPYTVHTVFLKTTLTVEGEAYVNNAMCQIKVLTLDLIVKIKGGSYRTHNAREELLLNGSLSSDPNEDPQNQRLIFSWTCHNQNGVKPSFCDGQESYSSLLKIRSDLLTAGDTLTFELTVQDSDKELSETDSQIVYLTDSALSIMCVKNCQGDSRISDAIYLKCRPFHADKTLVWTMDKVDAATVRQTGTTPDVFIIKPGTLEQGRTYVVTVSDANDPRIKSSYELTVGETLRKGTCEIYPASGIMGRTRFSIKCKNYGTNDPDNKLVYEFYQYSGVEPKMLGFNYIGTIRSIVLTYDDVRVRIYDRIGNVVHQKLNVTLVSLEVNSSNIQNITETIETTRKLLDHPSMLRHIQVLTWMLPQMNADQQQRSRDKIIHEIASVFDDVDNTLNYLLIQQALSTLKDFLNMLKDIQGDEYYLPHRVVRYTGQYLLKSAKSIHTEDAADILESHSMITDVNLYETNQMMVDCFALVEMNRDALLEYPTEDGMGHGLRYYSYLSFNRDIIETMNYKGLITQSSMFPQQENIRYRSALSKSLFWNKIDSPERLSNLSQIPNKSKTFVTLDKQFVSQFEPDTNLSLQVVVLENNMFWWYQPDDFGVNTSICGIFLHQVNNRDFKPIQILEKPLSIHLEVEKNLSRSEVTWNATKYGDNVDEAVKNSGIGSHRIPDLHTYSAIFVKFSNLKSSNFHLVWTKEQRPSSRHFLRDPHSNVSENNTFLLLPKINADDKRMNENESVADYFMGILPEMDGNHQYTFEMHRIDCRRWINDRWIIDPYCSVNNQSTLRTVICDCRHMSKFSASVLVVPNLVDPIGDAGLLLTVLDNPTPVLFVAAILFLYVVLLFWARGRDKMDRHRGRIVILKDNCPEDQIVYLVTVYTGSRPYAGTTSDVCIQLFGEHGSSRPHLLQDRDKRTLQRGNDDWFLLLTPQHLGRISRIKLWSNHCGHNPDWYCYQVEVRDFQTRSKYLFFVQRWLSVLQDDECLVVTVKSQDQADPKSIWKKMWEWNVKASMQDKHPAASFLIRHPRTTGNRVEKLSVAVAGIMTILVTSLMFYEKSETDEEAFEFYEIKFRDLAIAWESLIVEFIMIGIVMYCFDKSRPDAESLKEKVQVVDEDEIGDSKEDDDGKKEGIESNPERENARGDRGSDEDDKDQNENPQSREKYEKDVGKEKSKNNRDILRECKSYYDEDQNVEKEVQSKKSDGVVHKVVEIRDKIKSRLSFIRKTVTRHKKSDNEDVKYENSEIENLQGQKSRKCKVWRSNNDNRHCLTDDSTQEIYVVESDDDPMDEREENDERYCTINVIEDTNEESDSSGAGSTKTACTKLGQNYCTASSDSVHTDLYLSRLDFKKEINYTVNRMENTRKRRHEKYTSDFFGSRNFYSISEVTDTNSRYYLVKTIHETPNLNDFDSIKDQSYNSIREIDRYHNRDSVTQTVSDKIEITVKDYSSDSNEFMKEMGQILNSTSEETSHHNRELKHTTLQNSVNSGDVIIVTNNINSNNTLLKNDSVAEMSENIIPRVKTSVIIAKAEMNNQNGPSVTQTRENQKQSKRSSRSEKKVEDNTESNIQNESFNFTKRNISFNKTRIINLKEKYNAVVEKYEQMSSLKIKEISHECNELQENDTREYNRLRKRCPMNGPNKKLSHEMNEKSKNTEETISNEKGQNEDERKEVDKWDLLVIVSKLRSYVSRKILDKAVIEPYFPTSIEKREQFIPKVKKAWFILAWTLLITNIVLSAYLIVLYGLKFGKTKATVWLSTTVLGIGQDFFFATPCQILLLSFVLAKFYYRTQKTHLYYVNSDFYRDKFNEWQKKDCEYVTLTNLKRLTRIYRPVTEKEICTDRKCRQKTDARHRLMRELIICVLSIFIILSIIDLRSTSMAHFNKRYYQHFLLSGKSPSKTSFRDIQNQTSLYNYLNGTLLPVLSAMAPDKKQVQPSETQERRKRGAFNSTHQIKYYHIDVKNIIGRPADTNRKSKKEIRMPHSQDRMKRGTFVSTRETGDYRNFSLNRSISTEKTTRNTPSENKTQRERNQTANIHDEISKFHKDNSESLDEPQNRTKEYLGDYSKIERPQILAPLVDKQYKDLDAQYSKQNRLQKAPQFEEERRNENVEDSNKSKEENPLRDRLRSVEQSLGDLKSKSNHETRAEEPQKVTSPAKWSLDDTADVDGRKLLSTQNGNSLTHNESYPIQIQKHPNQNGNHKNQDENPPLYKETRPIHNENLSIQRGKTLIQNGKLLIHHENPPTQNETKRIIHSRPPQVVHHTSDSLDNTILISAVRMRQQRVKLNSCRLSSAFSDQFIANCNANLNPMSEDTSHYTENWQTKTDGETEIEAPNDLSLPLVDDPWMYQNETLTNIASRYSNGANTMYNGGGYVKDLGSSASAISRGLSQMIVTKWLDDRTRVLFIECSLYNPNINAIADVSLVVERLASNTYSTDPQIGLLKLVTNADMEGLGFYTKLILYTFLILLYTYQLYHLSRYSMSHNNALYDMLILFLTILCLSQYFMYGRCLSKTLKYYQSSKEITNDRIHFKQHVSFSHCKRLHDLYCICLSVLTFLIFCRLFKLVQYFQHESLRVFTALVRFQRLLTIGLGVIFLTIIVLCLVFNFFTISLGTMFWVVQILVVILLVKSLVFNG